MTESKTHGEQDHPLVFSKNFEDLSIKFIKRSNKVWLTSSAIANGLQIDRTNINQIFHNNKQLLEPYSAVMIFITVDGKKREVRVFDKKSPLKKE